MKSFTFKRQKQALECLKKGSDFNLKLPQGNFIMYVGGILAKLEEGVLYFCINKKWVKAEFSN